MKLTAIEHKRMKVSSTELCLNSVRNGGHKDKKLKAPYIRYGFHYTDFNETPVHSTSLYRILSKSVEKWGPLDKLREHKINYGFY